MGLVRQLTPMYDSAYCTSLAGTPDGVISRLFCLARISIRARLGLYGRGLSTVCAFLV